MGHRDDDQNDDDRLRRGEATDWQRSESEVVPERVWGGEYDRPRDSFSSRAAGPGRDLSFGGYSARSDRGELERESLARVDLDRENYGGPYARDSWDERNRGEFSAYGGRSDYTTGGGGASATGSERSYGNTGGRNAADYGSTGYAGQGVGSESWQGRDGFVPAGGTFGVDRSTEYERSDSERFAARRQALQRKQEEVQLLLDRMAHAVTTGDGRAIAELWETPSLVLGEAEVRAVGSSREIEEFFGGAKEQYNARGITDTRAEIVRLEWLTDRIALVEVCWPYLDAGGASRGEETSTYTLRRNDQGELKLRVAVMHGARD